MELWIRSQDRMLLSRVVDIRIVIEQEGASIIDDTTNYILGMYNTEERALEVLNVIQSILEQILDPNLTTLKIFVYEMPKE